MGTKESKPKSGRSSENTKSSSQYSSTRKIDDKTNINEEYLQMMRKRRQKDEVKHQTESMKQGKAYVRLQQKRSREEQMRNETRNSKSPIGKNSRKTTSNQQINRTFFQSDLQIVGGAQQTSTESQQSQRLRLQTQKSMGPPQTQKMLPNSLPTSPLLSSQRQEGQIAGKKMTLGGTTTSGGSFVQSSSQSSSMQRQGSTADMSATNERHSNTSSTQQLPSVGTGTSQSNAFEFGVFNPPNNKNDLLSRTVDMSSGGPQQAIGGIPIKSDSFYITTREPSQSMSTAGTVRYVFINTEALEDQSLEWASNFKRDLERLDDSTIFKFKIMAKLDTMLGSLNVTMDPKTYRRLYRDKAFRHELNLPSAARQSGPISSLQTRQNAHQSAQVGVNPLSQTVESQVKTTNNNGALTTGNKGGNLLLQSANVAQNGPNMTKADKSTAEQKVSVANSANPYRVRRNNQYSRYASIASESVLSSSCDNASSIIVGPNSNDSVVFNGDNLVQGLSAIDETNEEFDDNEVSQVKNQKQTSSKKNKQKSNYSPQKQQSTTQQVSNANSLLDSVFSYKEPTPSITNVPLSNANTTTLTTTKYSSQMSQQTSLRPGQQPNLEERSASNNFQPSSGMNLSQTLDAVSFQSKAVGYLSQAASSLGSGVGGVQGLTNEERTMKQFWEHDIVGLSISGFSQKSAYSTKFNTLRQHLTTMPNHPIVKLNDEFRDNLRSFLQERERAINQTRGFFENSEEQTKTVASEYQKLVKQVCSEIKSYVSLIHDALICFYMLDVKVDARIFQNTQLANLVTSLLLKNPVYSEIHQLIRLSLRPQVKKIVNTIGQIRSNNSLDLDQIFKIDPVAIGRFLYDQSKQKKKMKEEAAKNGVAKYDPRLSRPMQMHSASQYQKGSLQDNTANQNISKKSDEEELMPPGEQQHNETNMVNSKAAITNNEDSTNNNRKQLDEAKALAYFRKNLKNFENVRNISSPIFKLITTRKVITDFVKAISGEDADSGALEADSLQSITFYLLCKVQTSEEKYLGARLLEECVYIDSFLHESQTNQDQEYTCIEHIKFSLELLEKGLESCQTLLGGAEGTNTDGVGSSTQEEGEEQTSYKDDNSQEQQKQLESQTSIVDKGEKFDGLKNDEDEHPSRRIKKDEQEMAKLNLGVDLGDLGIGGESMLQSTIMNDYEMSMLNPSALESNTNAAVNQNAYTKYDDDMLQNSSHAGSFVNSRPNHDGEYENNTPEKKEPKSADFIAGKRESSSKGMSVLQKLRKEGLLAAKTRSTTQNPHQNQQQSSEHKSDQFTTPSSSGGGNTQNNTGGYEDKYASPLQSSIVKSFGPDSCSNNSDLPQSSLGPASSTQTGVKLRNYSEAESLASRSTKASTVAADSLRLGMMMNSTDNKLEQQQQSQQSRKTKLSNENVVVVTCSALPIIHEELQVEEGCDNELEKSRLTLQEIRVTQKMSQTGTPNESNNTSVDNKSGDQRKSGDEKQFFVSTNSETLFKDLDKI